MNSKVTATQTTINACACGTCHEQVGPKAIYRPGHDARHVSTLLQGLINAHADGKPITKSMINSEVKQLPSEALRAKFRRAADRLVAKLATETKEADK